MDEARPVILIVDDTPENIDVLVGLLRDRYTIKVATDGPRALALATAAPTPDLVLLDIMMPGMDGFEVCRQFKAREVLEDIPIIFISALSETMDKVKAFSVGGVDYVTKPFQSEEVEARIDTHLTLQRLRRELEARNRQLQEQYDQLHELEELRDNLVHMVIHDMRSPLMGLCGLLQLLQMQASDALDEI